jgi:hypothetical protein
MHCWRLAAAFALVLADLPARVILVSFDGLGHQILRSDPAARALKTHRLVAQRGAIANGIQPAFPSTTANSHAAIWTGVYGRISNVTFNSQPLPDRARHTFLERETGFRSTTLAAEPIWVTAARQGKRAVAHQATQAYPFREINTAPGAVVVNGYQTRQIARASLQLIEKERQWEAGPARLRAIREGDRIRVHQLSDGREVVVPILAAEKAAPRKRDLARRFSPPLLLRDELPLAVYFRAFPRPDGRIALLQTAIQELALHDGQAANPGLVLELITAEGPFLPNGAGWLLDEALISPEEYLESVELQIRQTLRHAGWLNRRFSPDLLQSYLPFPDEADHRWIGLDRLGDASARRYREWVYAALEQAARTFAALAGKGDSVVFVSDHGMTPVRQAVNMAAMLKQAGLQAQVAHLTQAFLLNSSEFREGTVASEQRDEILTRLRSALGQLRDPESGEPIVTGLYTPAEHGEALGIGGPAGADLYYDLRPGWSSFSSSRAGLLADNRPTGTHGFLPTRDDMLAILVASGPAISPKQQWPRMPSINIAPLVAELLGVAPPRDARGASPLRKPASSPSAAGR